MALQKRIVFFGPQPESGPGLDDLLRARGFRVYRTEFEESLLDALRFSRPDVLLLLGPHLPTFPRLTAARRSSADTLVVVVWPAVPVDEATSLLDLGVDYVAGTFNPDWIAAQIRACLRRIGKERQATSVIELGYLRIDLDARKVTVDGREAPLTPTEFEVLRTLAERPGTVLAGGEIMQQVLGVPLPEPEAQDLVKVHIHRLRSKLEQNPESPRFIRTVRGHGYMYAFERRSQPREEP